MLKDTIKEELKKAMQNKEADRLSVLRMVSSAINNKQIEKRTKLNKQGEEPAKVEELSQLTDEEVIEVIASEIKKRKDAIEQFGKAGRSELAESEKKEMDILMEYMPEQMPEDEVRRIIKAKIEEIGASSPAETGKVMGAVMPELKGKADGGMINKIVQEELKE